MSSGLRGIATRGAALAVVALQAGGRFAAVHQDGRLEGLSWPDGAPDALPTLAYVVMLAEARGRICDLKDLKRRHPDAWPAIAATFGIVAGQGPDETLRPAAVAALNAPRLWAIVQGLSGALLARGSLDQEAVAAAIERPPFIPAEAESAAGPE